MYLMRATRTTSSCTSRSENSQYMLQSCNTVQLPCRNASVHIRPSILIKSAKTLLVINLALFSLHARVRGINSSYHKSTISQISNWINSLHFYHFRSLAFTALIFFFVVNFASLIDLRHDKFSISQIRYYSLQRTPWYHKSLTSLIRDTINR